jgi:D-3-phosphoglycerate dehydrogenase
MKIDIFIIDFDSTFVTEESLELITKIALYRYARKKKVLSKLARVGDLCMKSKIDFKDNLKMRIEILNGILKEEHLIRASKILEGKISPDILKIIELAKNMNKKIIVVSNSFKVLMKEVMKRCNIEIYFANKYEVDEEGFVSGYNETNPMANNAGKENIIKFLKNVGIITPEEKIMMIGDGMSDLKVYQNGCCDYFLGFSINKTRKLKKHRKDGDDNFIICRKSDDFDEFLKKVE